MSSQETANKLLDEAQVLIQERGYNAFSYKDLAAAIGIRTASIHYHFPGKASLGLALMERYIEQLNQALANIDRKGRNGKAKLKGFIKLYGDAEARGAICLCGSLASDRETLPTPLQEAVKVYIENSEQWIAATVKEGVNQGEFAFSGKPGDAAAALLSSLQGGLILSRAKGGSQSLLTTLQRVFLKSIEPA